MEENLKRNFNLISLQHGALNFAAISLDDRRPFVDCAYKRWAYTSSQGVLGGLTNRGAITEAVCNWNRKGTSKQAIAVLIKIRFALLVLN